MPLHSPLARSPFWQMAREDVKSEQAERGGMSIMASWFVSCYLPSAMTRAFHALSPMQKHCGLRCKKNPQTRVGGCGDQSHLDSSRACLSTGQLGVRAADDRRSSSLSPTCLSACPTFRLDHPLMGAVFFSLPLYDLSFFLFFWGWVWGHRSEMIGVTSLLSQSFVTQCVSFSQLPPCLTFSLSLSVSGFYSSSFQPVNISAR